MSAKATILIIEDDLDLRELISEWLDLCGYHTLVAPNGREGLLTAILERPDLVICDVMMPEMDGYETVRMMRCHIHLQHIPFVFLTALSRDMDRRRAMNLGADDFLAKPFDNDELLHVVETRLQRVRQIQTAHQAQLETLRIRLREQEHLLEVVSQLNSHQLRGPLVRMIELIRMLAEEMSLTGTLGPHNVLEILAKSAKEMDQVIHEINRTVS